MFPIWTNNGGASLLTPKKSGRLRLVMSFELNSIFWFTKFLFLLFFDVFRLLPRLLLQYARLLFLSQIFFSPILTFVKLRYVAITDQSSSCSLFGFFAFYIMILCYSYYNWIMGMKLVGWVFVTLYINQNWMVGMID